MNLRILCNISLPIGEIRVAVNPCNWFEILKIKFEKDSHLMLYKRT